MRKKLKITLVSLVFLLANIFTLTACDFDFDSYFDSDDDYIHTHYYGAWSETAAATCTERGEESRYCSCGEIQTRTTSTKEHSYGEWCVIEEASCSKAGQKKRTCTCGAEQTNSIPALPHTYNEGIVTKEPACTVGGSKTLTCTVCNATKSEYISSLGHSVDGTETTGKCSRCELVVLNMTSTEINESQRVETIKYSALENSNGIDVNITLLDGNDSNRYVPAYVDVKIVDVNGDVLYSDTLIKTSYKNEVFIDYDKISNSSNGNGILYYRVYSDYFSFTTFSKELDSLPQSISLELPNVPQTLWSYDNYSFEITEITYKVRGNVLYLYFSGKKTFDEDGDSDVGSLYINWRLCDGDGYIIDDGSVRTPELTVGEKFKNVSDSAVIEPEKTYRLIIYE